MEDKLHVDSCPHKQSSNSRVGLPQHECFTVIILIFLEFGFCVYSLVHHTWHLDSREETCGVTVGFEASVLAASGHLPCHRSLVSQACLASNHVNSRLDLRTDVGTCLMSEALDFSSTSSPENIGKLLIRVLW